ncbi:class I SAM-dependent methyltransferase [Nostoc sp.]|uniref:class I SAM-dependent methyltransferase n=1 Tax=Nostoc sp. TaxID=1180 RepID=UPI002FFA3A64
MSQRAKKETESISVDNQHRHNQCPCCGGSALRKVGGIQYASPLYFSTIEIKILHQPELWKCLACESGFVQNALTEEDAKKLYSSGDAEQRWSSPSFKQAKTAVVVETLADLLKPGVRVLDIGCSSGNWLDYAQQKGATTAGVEYSSVSLQLVAQKGHKGFSSIQQVDSHFDIITAFDLVEHLYDIPAFLEICLTLLSPDGLLLLLTGDITCFTAKILASKWWYVSYPEHIVFPSLQFFGSHPDFNLVSYLKTYASPDYQQPLLRTLKLITLYLLKGNYSGSPSLVSDHIMVMLQSKK